MSAPPLQIVQMEVKCMKILVPNLSSRRQTGIRYIILRLERF